jgi:two-component system, chemotaxis family, response regulator Rcp1
MMSKPKTGAWNILLIEDNAADVRLTQEVLRDSPRPLKLHVARDGEQAIQMLSREASYADVPEPDLVLLDLNLPRRHGKEVLAWLKQHPKLRHIPVIVLSTSQAEAYVAACYQLHANCYLQKPLSLDAFAGTMRQLEEFWFKQVSLPPKDAAVYQ